MAGYPRYFYPRPPRGGRPEFPVRNANREIISIHALREEGDGKLYCGECGRLIFLSTPSARRATRGRAGGAPPEAISIHALREEGNRALTGTSAVVSKFLSTPSARRATSGGADREIRHLISIHALREEGDWMAFPMV